MATLKKYDRLGNEVGEVSLEDSFLEISVNQQMVKDYIVALRQNARQWSANTKGRSEVNHTGKKPHPQKGQGRSRQGCLAAPQYKGGGRVFAPKPKFDQHVRINRKERRIAIQFLLAEKLKNQQVNLLKWDGNVSKTKEVSNFFKKVQCNGKRILFLADLDENIGKYDPWVRCMRNIPKTEFAYISNVNGYDLALSHQIIVMESAWKDIVAMFGKRSGE